MLSGVCLHHTAVLKDRVKVEINLPYSPVPKLCVPFFRAWISANGESGGLHPCVGCCLHRVSPARAAPGLDASPAPPTPFYHTLPTRDTFHGTFPHAPRLAPDVRLSPHPAQHLRSFST